MHHINVDSSHGLFALVYAERPTGSKSLGSLNGPTIHKSIASVYDELLEYVKDRILDCAVSDFVDWAESDEGFIKSLVLPSSSFRSLPDDEKAEYFVSQLTGLEAIKVVKWYFDHMDDDVSDCYFKINSFENFV